MKDTIKGAVWSRTIWLGLAITVLGTLQANAAALFPNLDPAVLGQVNAILGMCVVIVRFFTTLPLDKR